ncbi:pyridoxal phosphate-dependent aminotransferase [Bifidobacterium eulemuris]|uniref:alanine transaminase n=1 Tax=Bifidobacterium eulemuris TaxID=1765219 RepID=A0A261GBR5_9BIFI|nr:pyridoxal phosphate-dependent aminotransferase [Bifidobacterium eulemuris]OZG68877.1 aminotransferase [Bifidobacterium eulemuris]QOL31581.1 pyridoxal phosphate-dependent aminotransferase [Bifidobacterium eulemuris]
MTVRFSSRVDIREPNPIAVAEAHAKAEGVALGRLNDSNPTRHGLAPALVPGVYTADPRGPRKARESLAAFLASRMAGCLVDPDDLYLLSSTSQAYSWLFKLLCDPGDAVLAPKPGYPLIESIAALECVDTIAYRLRYDGSWYIDTGELAALLDSEAGARVRALVLINPNNPTGSYVKPSERETLVNLCAAHGVALIADEVFYDYTLEPFAGNARMAGERGALTFALDGFSKMLAAPHAKVGWIQVSGPDHDVAEAKRRLDVIADDYLPMSDLIAQAIPGLLDAAAGQTARVRERVRGNLARLHELLDQDDYGVTSVLRAEGGWNVLVRVPSVVDENELVLRLIEERRITGQPGYFFDMESNGYLAVSLLPEPQEFERLIHSMLSVIDVMTQEIMA